MEFALEPSFTTAEKLKFEKLSSFNFTHYWNEGADGVRVAEKVLLFKGIRLYENRLVQLIDSGLRNEKKNELFAVHLKLGHANLLAQDFAKALSAYQKAYNTDATSFWKTPSAFFGLGLVYFHFRAFPFAAETFNCLLYSYPDLEYVVEVYSRLGFIYKNLEIYDLALKSFNAALNCSFESWFLPKIELRFQVAHCYDCGGDLEKAFSEYRTLLADPTTQLSVSLRARILRQLGWICYRTDCPRQNRPQKILDAEGYLIQSRDLEPSCGKTYYYLGRCYGELTDRARDAFVNYRESIDKSEADADTWCSIGVLYQQQNQPMDALQAFICAVQLDSEHSAAWTDLGYLYETKNQFSDALSCYKTAIEYRLAAPEAVKERIKVLEKELHPSSLLIANPRALPQPDLPSLEEAWKQPIPAELNQRQEDFLKKRQQRYRDGVQLLPMHSLLPTMPNSKLTPVQSELLKVLRANKTGLNEENLALLEQLEQKFADLDVMSMGRGEKLPGGLVSQDDLVNVLGSAGIKHDYTPTNQRNSNQNMAGTSHSENKAEDRVMNGQHGSIQVEAAPSSSDLPGSFSLLSNVHLPVTVSAEEILEECEKRIKSPTEFREIFEERIPPPKPPEAPKEKLSNEQLRRKTYLVMIEQKKDAFSVELQNFCKNKPIILIRGLTTALRMDLAIFSTKSFREFPDHPVELRTQYRMSSPDINVDHLGKPTWSCHSVPSKTDIRDYAQYQAQYFQHCLKEEAEKLRAAGAKYGGSSSSDGCNVSAKRRRTTIHDECVMPMKTLKFGTNIDITDENKFHKQLNELAKLPSFCRPASGCNMLTHLGHPVVGMNTVQLYLKVPGARTPGHQENNWLASVNINIGPGDCEWFAVPYEYWGVINEMLKKRNLDFLKGSWWPDYEELIEAGVPVYRFVQKAGDIVFVGSGSVHWVQSLGWCNNIAWNVAPLTSDQYQMITFSHEWNKLHNYMSLVPVQHLSWQLARNVRFSDQKLYTLIKNMLIRSLAYSKMIYDMVVAAGKAVQMHSRHKGDSSPYCSVCEVEVWNVVFAKPENGKYIVYCVQCARNADLNNFRVLQQYTFEELATTYDNFRLYPQNRGTTIC